MKPKIGSLKKYTKLANPQPDYLDGERENRKYSNQEKRRYILTDTIKIKRIIRENMNNFYVIRLDN